MFLVHNELSVYNKFEFQKISYSDCSLLFEKRSFQDDSDLMIKSAISDSAPKSKDILAQPPPPIGTSLSAYSVVTNLRLG